MTTMIIDETSGVRIGRKTECHLVLFSVAPDGHFEGAGGLFCVTGCGLGPEWVWERLLNRVFAAS